VVLKSQMASDFTARLTNPLWGKSLEKPNPARFLGALLTYLSGLALVVGLIA